MKFKVEIDLNEVLNELFVDYDPEYGIDVDIDLKHEIKTDITHQAKQAVLKEVKEPLRKDIEDRVKILVKDAYAEEVSETVKKFIREGKLQGRYKGDPEITVNEWIEREFEGSVNNDVLKKAVQNQANNVSEELKGRYDMFFATQLVMKMNDQGLLKDGVMSTLDLPKKEG